MKINYIYETKYTISEQQKELFAKIVNRVNEILKYNTPSVFSLIIVDDTQIHQINKQYRNIDRPTDVISFASLEGEYFDVEDEIELGDIFISVDAIFAQAKEYNHSFEREFSFLFTHGLLHLLGYDHMDVEGEKEMFSLQDEILDEIISK